MKEIAEALREAGDAAYDPENELLDRAWFDKYESLANQVEQMRCETCKWFEEYKGKEELTIGSTYDWCENEEVSIRNFGPNFFCPHHKFKEVKNGSV